MSQEVQAVVVFSRRNVLGGFLGAGAALAAGPVRAAWSQSGPDQGAIAFDIRREGDSIGRHEVSFRRRSGMLEVDIAIDISVSFAFIPVFSYRHRNHEVWLDGRLLSLDSVTEDDGRRYSVSARSVGGGLHVVGEEGELRAPADILTTSYWDVRTVSQSRLLDTQHGRLLEVSPRFLGEEVLEDGSTARRHHLAGDLDLDLWYGPSSEWLKIAFEARGAQISYARQFLTRGSENAG